LPADEKAIWRTVVDSMPPNWFGGQTEGVLRRYCFHLALADRISVEIRKFRVKPTMTLNDVKIFERLLAACDRETTRVSSLAVKLRITPQSSKHPFSAEASVRKMAKVRPWEDA